MYLGRPAPQLLLGLRPVPKAYGFRDDKYFFLKIRAAFYRMNLFYNAAAGTIAGPQGV